jgi:hypothetical protein
MPDAVALAVLIGGLMVAGASVAALLAALFHPFACG